MNYRFFMQERIDVLIPKDHAWELSHIPKRGSWPIDWEWSYDFPDVWRELRKDAVYCLYRLSLSVLRFTGVNISEPIPEYNRKIEQVSVTTENLVRALRDKLTEREINYSVQRKMMIIIGQREFHELRSQPSTDFMFHTTFMMSQERQEEYGGPKINTYFCGVPVLVLGDFVGVAIVPDLSNLSEQVEIIENYKEEKRRYSEIQPYPPMQRLPIPKRY